MRRVVSTYYSDSLFVQFTASEDHTWEQTRDHPHGVTAPLAPRGPLKERRAKKSRWDTEDSPAAEQPTSADDSMC